jgi:hypothetical protein
VGSHFKTVIGGVTFSEDGEWFAPRMIVTQLRHRKGNSPGAIQEPGQRKRAAAGVVPAR